MKHFDTHTYSIFNTQLLLARLLTLLTLSFTQYILSFFLSLSSLSPLIAHPSIYQYNSQIALNTSNLKVLIAILILFPILLYPLSHYYLSPILSEAYLLLLSILIAVTLLLTSNDFLIFFIAFELLNFSLYLTLASIQPHHTNSFSYGNAPTINYFFLSSLITTSLLIAILLFYYLTGSTNFDDISLFIHYTLLPQSPSTNLSLQPIPLILLLITQLFKLAAAPLHSYAPDLYNSLPLPFSLFFKTFPKVIFIYLLVHFWYTFSLSSFYFIHHLLLFFALLSLIIASSALIAQYSLKRFLAFSSITNLGYILLTLQQSIDLTTLLLYLITYYISLYAIFSLLIKLSLHYNTEINTFSFITGLYTTHLIPTLILATHLFALLGLPPFHTFFTKSLLLMSFVSSNAYYLALIKIAATLVTAAFYLSFIATLFRAPSQNFPTPTAISPVTPLQLNYTIKLLTLLALFFIFKPFLLLQLTL